jgi:hypothetical protein
MFEFFKEYWEIKGYDSDRIKAAKYEKKEEKKLTRYILSASAKYIMIAAGCLYIILAVSMVASW